MIKRILLVVAFVVTGVLAQDSSAVKKKTTTSSRSLLLKNSGRFAMGAYSNKDPLVQVAATMKFSSYMAMHGSVEYVHHENSYSVSIFPSVIMSLTQYLKDTSTFKPWARGGFFLWVQDHDGIGESSKFRLGLQGGSEIELGPNLIINPYLLLIMLEGNDARLGMESNFFLTPAFALGIDVSMEGFDLNESIRLAAQATLCY